MPAVIRARAPGKLMVVGEYAVLAGAPALMVAVDRAVDVVVDTGRPGVCSAHPLGVEAKFGIRDGKLRWQDPDTAAALGQFPVLLSAWAAALAHTGSGLPPFGIRVDSSALYHGNGTGYSPPAKLGLGSSAAVAAAAGIALWQLARPDAPAAPDNLFRQLLPVYRRASGGPASGADLAASIFGGTLVLEDAPGAARVRPLDWPPQLVMAAVWTGQPAATGAGVAGFEAWRRRTGAAGKRLLEDMANASRQVLEHLEPLDFAGLADALENWRALLGALDSGMDGRILTAPHRALERLAERAGVLYKSCGAGGGDVGLALSDEPGRLDRFRSMAGEAGLRPVELTRAGRGARCITG